MKQGIGAGLLVIAACVIHAGVQARQQDTALSAAEVTGNGERSIAIGETTTPGVEDALFTITRPGSYRLAADTTGVAGKAGIEIAADDVSIDLGGFALIGVKGSLEGIRVRPTHANLRVSNGTIRDWGGMGVDARLATTSHLVGLKAEGNGGMGFAVTEGGLLDGCTSLRNAEEDLAVLPPLRCKAGSCAGGPATFSYLLALPITSPIADAISLFQSIPHATRVAKFNPATSTFWTYNGTTCGGQEPGCSASCFCVHPGESFLITTDTASNYPILGIDGSMVLTLQGPNGSNPTGTNYISLPFCSNITTASQLINDIGLASVTNVKRFICETDSYQSYTGRIGTPPGFSLNYGEGYVVTMRTTVNYTTKYTPGCTATTCASCAVPPVNMVAWWRLDDTSGTTATDNAGANHGTITGATQISGQVDGALRFNGTTAEVTVPDNAAIDFGTGDFSIDAWISSTGSGIQPILDKRETSPTTRGYTLFLSSGRLAFQMADAGGAGGTCGSAPTDPCRNFDSGITVNSGSWVHVAVTVTRNSATGGKFYVNGAQVATFDPTTKQLSLDSSAVLYLGRHASSGRYTGDIDEVELFNRALSAGEVAAIFSAGADGKCKDSTRFCNKSPVSIPNLGAASPYPSTITASGIDLLTSCVTVNLNGVTHTWPGDIDVLLAGPDSSNAIIMSDTGAGSGAGVTGVNLLLDDEAAVPLPSSGPLVSGTFQPTNYGAGDPFTSPAPSPLGGSALDIFKSTDPNGVWSLYVVDDASGDSGSFANGWCVNIFTCDCDDGNPCTDDTCDCATGQCYHTVTDSLCDDNNPCTYGDACSSGVCTGTPLTCTDDQCNTRACNGTSSCTVTPRANGTSCNDGLFCNGSDTCTGGSCSTHGTNPCPGADGDNNCAESCNEATDTCNAADPNGSACNDGLFCNGSDTCNAGACSTHGVNPCPGADGDNNCAESCNEATDTCNAADPNGSACNDGLFCNGSDTCNAGACSTHGVNPCPGADGDNNCAESCNEATDTCNAADPNGSACSDGAFCNGTDTCSAGVCSSHTGDPCAASVGDADNNCAESCNEATDTCTANDPNGSACSDGAFCNGTDACSAGVCSSHAGDPCAANVGDADNNCAESCNEATDTCTANDPNGSACNDALFCNGSDTCTGGACSTHGANPCPGADGDSNCSESCNEATDTCNAADPNGSACNDGLFCNGSDTCTAGACTTHGAAPCPGADGDSNCAESCNESTDTCNSADPNGSACNDGLFCNGSDTCSAGACSTHGVNPCPGADGDNNCSESCNEATDTCNAADPNGSACNDGLFCNGSDTCSAGACSTHGVNPCPGADGDNNCSESCNEATDTCNAADPNGSACDDGLFCNGSDTCSAGACSTHGVNPCQGADGDSNCSESCNEATGTCNAADPNGSACNDGLFCNGSDTCAAGACSIHGVNPCPGADGDNNCAESCDEAADNCTAADPNGSACDDGDACTAPDSCSSGACGCGGTASTSSYANSTPVLIPTTAEVVSSSILIQTVDSFLGRVRLTTHILHSNSAHLDITLTSPTGRVVTITSDNGGANDDNFNGTVWDDDADSGGQVPYAYNNGIVTDAITANGVALTLVVPEEALAAFHGENPNGYWTLRVSDDTDSEGGTLVSWSLNVTTFPGTPTTTTATFNNGVPTALGDNPAVSTSTIQVTGVGDSIDHVRATTFIRHTFPGDLDITLRSPAGTVVTLATDNGGNKDNVFNGTVWDDKADPASQVPFPADSFASSRLATDTVYANNAPKPTLAPEEALGAFLGENPNGTWTLTVSDDSPGDTGTLDQWSLEITSGTNPCHMTCDDQDVCTNDSCDPVSGCIHVPVSCDDNNTCTDDACIPATGCTHTPHPDDSPCDDGDVCTLNDHCAAGACTGTPVVCDDGDACTENYCASIGGGGVCVVVPLSGTACNDGDVCTVNDHCQNGDCVGGGSLNCNDANACTDDSCDSSLPWGCTHANNTGPCDDADICTENDVCKAPAGGPGGLFEGFDGVLPPPDPPNLPVGWTRQVLSGNSNGWVISTSSHTPPYAVTAGNQEFSTDEVLVSPPFVVPCASQVTFRNRYDLEPGFDGAVLEISIAGGPFTDIIVAGGSFAAGGYDATIWSSYGNSLGGRPAWTGDSGGFIVSSVNLPAAAVGQSIQLRWRVATDATVCGVGQFVDSIVAGWCPNTCSGTPISCDDGNDCTDDACIGPTTGCVHPADDGNQCTDNDPCTIDHCASGTCVSIRTPVAVNSSVTLSRVGAATMIAWNDPPGPYNVYIGQRSGAWSYNLTCFASGVTGSSTVHSAAPPPGVAFYFLVSRRYPCEESIVGQASNGQAIPNSSPCGPGPSPGEGGGPGDTIRQAAVEVLP